MELTEAADVAKACAEAYRQLIAYYRAEQGVTPAEADALARQPHPTAAAAPSHELPWMSLNGLLESNPEAAAALWQRVKADAAQHVGSGSHIAEALRHESPWQRAQFAVLRQALHQDWQPTGAVESLLLDTYAASYLAHIYWLGKVHERDALPARRREWEVPMQREADALDQAAVMADRFHRQMVRTLRSMRDLRRYTITINGDVGQLNVAAQQVNAARIEQDTNQL